MICRGIIEEHALLRPDHVMQSGLGKIGRRNGCLSDDNLDLARVSGGFRFDPRLTGPNQDQQTPLGPGMLHRDSHEFLDQPGKEHLARKRLRSFHYGLDIKLSDWRANRDRRGARSLFQQSRVPFVELFYLSVCAPTVVAVPRRTKMGVASRFKTARQAVLRREFVGEALVLNEVVLTRRIDSLLVQTQGVSVSLFDARDLSQYQRVLVGERRRIVLGPLAQLFLVYPKEFAPSSLLMRLTTQNLARDFSEFATQIRR